jgi:hypothetical protein
MHPISGNARYPRYFLCSDLVFRGLGRQRFGTRDRRERVVLSFASSRERAGPGANLRISAHGARCAEAVVTPNGLRAESTSEMPYRPAV